MLGHYIYRKRCYYHYIKTVSFLVKGKRKPAFKPFPFKTKTRKLRHIGSEGMFFKHVDIHQLTNNEPKTKRYSLWVIRCEKNHKISLFAVILLFTFWLVEMLKAPCAVQRLFSSRKFRKFRFRITMNETNIWLASCYAETNPLFRAKIISKYFVPTLWL